MKLPKQGEIKASRRCKAAKKMQFETSRWFDGRWLCDSTSVRLCFLLLNVMLLHCGALSPCLLSQSGGSVFILAGSRGVFFLFFVSFLYVTAYSGHSCCPPLTLTLRCLREQPSSSLLSWQVQPFPRPRQQTPGDVSALLPLRRHHPAPSLGSESALPGNWAPYCRCP